MRFKEETEPLGQKISLQDTADAPTPQNGGLAGRADDPEWQCQVPQQFYGSFQALPEHCQMSLLRDLNKELKDIYFEKEQSPQKVTGGHEHGSSARDPSGSHGQSARMPVNLAPSAKPQAETSGASFIQASNIPSTDGCNSDAHGKKSCVVQSEGSETDPIESNNAEFGVENGRKLNKRELKQIADDIQLILDNSPCCQTGINAILENVQSDANPIVSKNLLDVFWATAKQGGIFVKYDSKFGGQQLGSIAKKRTSNGNYYGANSKIEVQRRNFDLEGVDTSQLSRKALANLKRSQEINRAVDVLDELMHAAGAFSYYDRELALATAEYLKIAPPQYAENDYTNWSKWFHSRFIDICSSQGAFNVINKTGGKK